MQTFSELDTIAFRLEGVPEIPKFFYGKGFKIYDREQRNISHNNFVSTHTIGCDSGRAYYQYDMDRKTLRWETSRRRLGRPLDALDGNLIPDGYYIPSLATFCTRADECITLPLDLHRFANIYAGPSRTKKIVFEGTGAVYRSGHRRLRIYDKRKEQNRKRLEDRDPRFTSGRHWRIESSYIGKKAVHQAGYSQTNIKPIMPQLLNDAMATLHAYLSRHAEVDLKASLSSFARFAFISNPELWRLFVTEVGGSTTKNMRRLSEKLGAQPKEKT